MTTSSSVPQFASLYVGDLHPDLTEAMLYEVFNAVGPVGSIRVCRDSVTRRSLGYGYVNFHSVSDAERALDTLNYSRMKGRSCRIMWSQRDPTLRKSGAGNIFVSNLDKNIDNKTLFDTFSLFGNILSCKVATDHTGKSYGYGFVHYETEEAAKEAINRVNGMKIGNQTVQVGEFKKRQPGEKPDVDNYTNLYVKHFPADWNEEKMVEVFSEVGPVVSAACRSDKQNRTFAFVNFEKTEDAKKAVETLHKKDVRTDEMKQKQKDEGKEGELDPEGHPVGFLYVSRAQTKAEREASLKAKFGSAQDSSPGVNLYVKNLDEKMDEEGLKEMFTPFGKVLSTACPKDASGKCKGFGFICCETADMATKAVTEMHLKVVSGKPLYICLAEKREERQRAKFGGKGDKGKGMFGKGGKPVGGFKGGPPQQAMMGPGGPRPMMPMVMGKGGGYMPGPQMMPMMKGMPGGMPMGPGMMPMMKGGPPMMMRPPMMPQPGMRPMGPGVPMGMPMRPTQPIQASTLAQAPPSVQKQMIGEKLYSAVSRINKDLAGKITGMMLEMDNNELLMMLESDQQLRSKVGEALRVLQSK